MITTVSFEVDDILNGIDSSIMEDWITEHIYNFCIANILDGLENLYDIEDYLERRGYKVIPPKK